MPLLFSSEGRFDLLTNCCYYGLVYKGMQSFRSIFVPFSGTGKWAVHTGMERLRTSFGLCLDGNAIVPLTCFLFACSDRSVMTAYRSTFRITKSPFTRESNRSTSFRIVPKSGTLKGCVQTGTLKIEPFRSKKWND